MSHMQPCSEFNPQLSSLRASQATRESKAWRESHPGESLHSSVRDKQTSRSTLLSVNEESPLEPSLQKIPYPKHVMFILGTEACEGFLPWSQGVYPGDWPRAETYAHDVIGDVNNWAGGWTDWNILLDMKGGPNWAGNVVDAPIIADTAGGQAVYKQPMFYYLGHITKFVPPGSVRIGFQSSGVPVLSAPMECATIIAGFSSATTLARSFKWSS